MKSLLLSSLLVTSAVLALPANNYKRQSIDASPSFDPAVTEATALVTDPEATPDAAGADSVDTTSSGTTSAPETTGSPAPEITGISGSEDGSIDIGDDGSADVDIEGDDTEGDDGDEDDTVAIALESPTGSLSPTGDLENPTSTIVDAPPLETGAFSSGSDSISTSGSGGGSCSPGMYQCSADKSGWEVCSALGTWVPGGACESGTTCTFLAANGSPYCVPGGSLDLAAAGGSSSGGGSDDGAVDEGGDVSVETILPTTTFAAVIPTGDASGDDLEGGDLSGDLGDGDLGSILASALTSGADIADATGSSTILLDQPEATSTADDESDGADGAEDDLFSGGGSVDGDDTSAEGSDPSPAADPDASSTTDAPSSATSTDVKINVSTSSLTI